jgi:hypothetical protein
VLDGAAISTDALTPNRACTRMAKAFALPGLAVILVRGGVLRTRAARQQRGGQTALA